MVMRCNCLVQHKVLTYNKRKLSSVMEIVMQIDSLTPTRTYIAFILYSPIDLELHVDLRHCGLGLSNHQIIGSDSVHVTISWWYNNIWIDLVRVGVWLTQIQPKYHLMPIPLKRLIGYVQAKRHSQTDDFTLSFRWKVVFSPFPQIESSEREPRLQAKKRFRKGWWIESMGNWESDTTALGWCTSCIYANSC